MAHMTSAITSMAEVPAVVKVFASSLGFATSGDDPVYIQHPTYAGAKTFTVRNLVTGTTAEDIQDMLYIELNVSGATPAVTVAPKLNPTGVRSMEAIVLPQPTAIHLFGEMSGSSADAGRSWIAGVIEYGFNLYRHFYLGYVEKTTSFSGGEVTAGSHFFRRPNSASSIWSSTGGDAVYPFSAYGSSSLDKGGVHVDHTNANQPWYAFDITGTKSVNDFNAHTEVFGDKVVLGGFQDSINTGYLTSGDSPFSGKQILVPVNLYLGKREGGVQRFQPIGPPGGARMVKMDNLTPGDEINVGSSVWRVYPVFSKREENVIPSTGITKFNFPPFNTSLYVGMAYLVSE